jgi:3-oxoadipate enol-lactonase
MPDPEPRGQVPLIATLEGPAGAPVLVLGNSLGTSMSVWDAQLPALSRQFRLLRYEHRGHGSAAGGYSPDPPGPYTIGELAADVLGLLDRFGVERAHYCGLSLGGMVGMRLASSAPDRIAGLVLCCTSAYLPPASLWTERAAAARAGEMERIAGQVVSRWFTPAYLAARPGAALPFAAALAATRPAGYAGCCEAIAAMDLRPVLARITAPTLVISAADDPATPPWHGAVIASGIAAARLTVIRGAAHLANVSNPGEVTAVLTAHLTGLFRRQT